MPYSFGQTLSLRQCSCCLGIASQIDLGSHTEIVQDCFHVQSICASCSNQVLRAFSAALRMRVLQLCVPMMNPSILVNTDDVDFIDLASAVQSASVWTTIVANSTSPSRVTARSRHSLLLANLSHSWSSFLPAWDSSCPATDHVHCCRDAVETDIESFSAMSSLRVLSTTFLTLVLSCHGCHGEKKGKVSQQGASVTAATTRLKSTVLEVQPSISWRT